jgi:predicted dinucleotide-binding enzyme
MKIAVLGTGMVGNTIGSKLIELGHEVKMGSRDANNEKAVNWASGAGSKASAGTFADAAAFGEVIFNCTSGMHSIEALKMAGEENLDGKLLIDLANALDGSKGMPPVLGIVNDDSLGETIQRTFPKAKVVKTLNTMNCILMTNPSALPGDHNVFVSGDDNDANEKAKDILKSFGWRDENIIDLGDIKTARGPEQLLPIWLRIFINGKDPMFNFHIVRPKK